MSEIPCNVIRDLMILYDDDVCSEESRQMVDEHMKECEACRELYQTAKEPLPEITLKRDEKEANDGSGDELWELARRTVMRFKRKLTYRHVLTFSIVILAVCMISLVWDEWLKFRINVIPSEDVQVSEIYELENGSIYCTFTCKDLIGRVNISDMEVPEGKGFRDCDEGWYEISFQKPAFYEKSIADQVYEKQVSVVFGRKSPEAVSWVEDEEGNFRPDESSAKYIYTCDSIYYNGKDKKDGLLVWKEGQGIKSAPEAVEARVKKERLSSEDSFLYSTRILY